MDLKIDKLRSDFHGHSFVESSLRRDDLGDMNDAHEIGDGQHDAYEDEVGDDQHDEAADEVHVAQKDEEDEVEKGAAEQDGPQQDEVNCVGKEQNRRRSKRLRKGATAVCSPYTAPQMVKDLVYLRRSSRR
ncbi:hypothetical protein Ddye_021395 [Dipteronia dyeriana]|uniref:Uncharacterized protein n=1 Tax=Dipteronia dyeriana TaxID=168575 RepID=A0AAD9WXX9_9ROSI|nr:hypothetical protein Ddye_021395 [Dipteronia dyeriana]